MHCIGRAFFFLARQPSRSNLPLRHSSKEPGGPAILRPLGPPSPCWIVPVSALRRIPAAAGLTLDAPAAAASGAHGAHISDSLCSWQPFASDRVQPCRTMPDRVQTALDRARLRPNVSDRRPEIKEIAGACSCHDRPC